MSWPWGRRSIGKTRASRSSSKVQPPAICGVSDEVAQVSMTSGSPTKPPGAPRCDSSYPAGSRSTGRPAARLVRDERLVVDRLAVGVEPVPDRERHAEVALPADQPVAGEPVDPVLVAHLHVRRVPVQLPAAGEQGLAQVGVAAAVAEVPLPGRDDLERPVALLVELHRVGDRLRLARRERRTRGASTTVSSRAANTVLPASRAYAAGVRRRRGGSGRSRPSRPRIARIGSCSSRHHMTSVRSPNVQIIAMPEPLSGSASRCATTGTSTPNSGVRTVVPNSGW